MVRVGLVWFGFNNLEYFTDLILKIFQTGSGSPCHACLLDPLLDLKSILLQMFVVPLFIDLQTRSGHFNHLSCLTMAQTPDF